jgi:uncharacterized OB-fold protein
MRAASALVPTHVFDANPMRTGQIYTETVVHLAPERFAADVPYQVVIVKLDEGGSITARVEGERVVIDDRVVETAVRDGISFFQKLL